VLHKANTISSGLIALNFLTFATFHQIRC